MTTEYKKKLADKLNISLKTFYTWHETKPYLIKLIELGLQKEKEIEHGLENEQDLAKKLEELTKRMDIIEKVK